MIDGNIGNILLDSGAVDRNFVTNAFVNKYELLKCKLAYKINIKSIHGKEIATEAVITTIKIISGDEEVEIKRC